MPAQRIVGVEPQRAFLARGDVYVSAAGATEAMAPWYDELPCAVSAGTDIVGQALGVGPAGPATGHLRPPPYTITFEVTKGSRLLGDGYSALRIELHVSRDTVGGTDEALVLSSLDGAPMRASVRCDGDRYQVESLGRAAG